MASKGTKKLGANQRKELLATIRSRFEQNTQRHKGVRWQQVHDKLEAHPERLWSIGEMERSGGEPDVIRRDRKTGELLFVDCSAESPKGRRSVCYDGEALKARKKNKPKGSAVELATAMGAALLSEDEYRSLQELGDFDIKTSSWLLTPPDVRRLGGAMFGDCRFGRVWVYHNGAESYYAARGFRCALKV